MNRKRISVQIILGFLMLVLLLASGCGGSDAPIPGTYTISGTVTADGSALPNVIITLSDGATDTTTTDASGNYSFTGLVDGSYTITPILTGYTFTPDSNPVVVSGGNVTSNFVATVTFTQADLAGTWKNQVLLSSGDFMRFTGEIDEDGFVTIPSEDCEATAEGMCPADNQLQWTIDSNGVISVRDTTVLSTTYQGRMTLNKNFIAGTDGIDLIYGVMMIAQKVVPGTVYEETDIQNKSFVLNQFLVVPAASNSWQRLTGITDGAGEVSISSMNSSGGSFDIDQPLPVGMTLTLDPATGVVTAVFTDEPPADLVFKGFLSDDKKTIVATIKDKDEDTNDEYNLMIIQITEPTFTIGPIPAGTYAGNVFGLGVNFDTSLWIRSLFTVNGLGSSSVIDWVSSNAIVDAAVPGGYYISFVSPSGTVKKNSDPTYSGQMSGDGMFIVGTQTTALYPSFMMFYSLGIDIRTNGLPTPEPD